MALCEGAITFPKRYVSVMASETDQISKSITVYISDVTLMISCVPTAIC